jgi:cytidylate kinase
MFRILTIGREFGSGGAVIARKVAEMLGWDLLDKTLVEQIAHYASVNPELARRYDERVDSWLHRVGRRGLWRGSFEGVAAVTDTDVFDAETMATLGKNLILEAYSKGNCVIIGRGGQCVLQDKQDAFHVFIYGRWADRVARVRQRMPEVADPKQLIQTTDQQRKEFIRLYFGCDWRNPHLYHMLISSELGDDEVAKIIVYAMGRSAEPRQDPKAAPAG